MLATAPIILFVGVLMVAMTTFGISRIEAVPPPAGQFILVDGVLQVAELGLARPLDGNQTQLAVIPA